MRKSWLAIPRQRRLAEVQSHVSATETLRAIRAESLAGWWQPFEPVWVAGLLLVTLLVTHFAVRLPSLDVQGQSYDYALYAAAGTVFPVLLLGIPLLWRWRGLPFAPSWSVRRILAVFALVWFVSFVVSGVVKHGVATMALPLVLTAAQTAFMGRMWRREAPRPAQATSIAAVAVVAWTVALSLGLETLIAPPVFLVGFVVAFVLACSATWESRPGTAALLFCPTPLANWAGVAVIAFMSLRTDGLFAVQAAEGQGAVHHWGAWIGPAELVRDGGWLLWDVPSMYGFLSILPLAILPTETPWQALYLLQGLSYFFVATGIFLIVRTLRPGWINWLLALTVAIAVPMFLPAFDAGAPVISTLVFPNFGPYRYLWCFVLVVLLLGITTSDDESPRARWLTLGGCLVWTIGVLWSAESAFYCSGVWLPAYAVMVVRNAMRQPTPWRTAMLGLVLPLAMLAGAVGMVAAVFQAVLGRLPDWMSFADYLLRLGTQHMVVVNDPTGPALGILLGFCILATATRYAGVRAGVPTRALALFVGLLGGFWATGIYGYTRGLPGLHPVAYAGLAIVLVLVARDYSETSWGTLVRAASVPLLTVLLVSPLAAVVASPQAVGEAAASLWDTARDGFAVEPSIPDADGGLQELMVAAGIGPDDPVSFQGSWLGNPMLPWRPAADPAGHRLVTTRDWLPGHPYVLLRYLPEGRGARYLGRFIDRMQQSGWLVQHKTGDTAKPPDQHEFTSGREAWFFPTLGQTHVPTRIYENEEWQLVWFEYVGRDSAVTRPIYTEYRGLAPLPPDVTLNGEPLSGQKNPAVWVLPGNGWGWYDQNRAARWVANGATLWVYSDRPREVILQPRFPRETRRMPALVATVGDEEPARTRRKTGTASIALRLGWNPVELRLEDRTLEPNTRKRSDRNSGVPANEPTQTGWYLLGLDIRTP